MKPKQFFFGLLGGLVVLAAAGGAGYYFALTQLKASSNNLATQLADQQAEDDQITTLQSEQGQYERQIVPILPLLDEALPRDKKQTEILAQLQNIATSVGLQITSISLPAPAGLPNATSQTTKDKGSSVLALPISFQIAGQYPQLQLFTQKVENLNRFTNITNLVISHQAGGVTYAMQVNAYIMPTDTAGSSKSEKTTK
jgi:Tfp pilus assembly protein PilO